MTSLYALDHKIPVKDYIYGLGGADVTIEILEQAFGELEQLAAGQIDGGLAYLGAR